MKSRTQAEIRAISRRAILKTLGLAPLLLRVAPLCASSLLSAENRENRNAPFPFTDVRLKARYPLPSPLADVLRFVPAGSDQYVTERYAVEIETILKAWGRDLTVSPRNFSSLASSLDVSIASSPLSAAKNLTIRSDHGIEVVKRQFVSDPVSGRDRFIENLQRWLGQQSRIETAEFEMFRIEEISNPPLTVQTEFRYDIVANGIDGRTEERVGVWKIEWSRIENQSWIARKWEPVEETACVVDGPIFVDVTTHALGSAESYKSQMLWGADYWRTILDGAVGVDVYGNNGVAAGDFDNDGFDDFYVCQPAGLPNRLYRNRGDGTFEDVTEKAGVGVLDSTACALFVDFRNKGLQDLIVVCGTGPLLFENQGNGTFLLKRDAFRFSRPPQGTFTHAAAADYDRDGRLDIYFCTYMYYLGLDQYHYPIPYYDARNGPPNCLMHNEGDGTFVEKTEESGLNADNDRYSFACAWGDANSDGLPDLFVANDFGSSQLYRNNGNGTFRVVSREAHVEGVGAGMSCCWADFDNDGRQDIYVPSMWEAAGQRVSEQKQFHEAAPQNIRELYQRHARGNALYRNLGDGTFQNVGRNAAVEMGRWSWSSDFWDFDHDGFADLYVANGYLSGTEQGDLAGFFWRQVVAKSSEDSTPSLAYERGWNAINELIRSDNTWHGYARNVLFVNNRDGTFTEASGPGGLDFIDDSRSFALADIDHDGRLEVILKNRNAPQLRIMRNAMKQIGRSISFSLRGRSSNRDAIGTAVTVEAGTRRQTKYLQAGSGFLSQHSKELFFGLGDVKGNIHATVCWPNGLLQHFDGLPADHHLALEEGVASFDARPFVAPSAAYTSPGQPPTLDPLPSQVETWLIEPLKAPNFSLPDLAGATHELSALQGHFVLLTFWADASASSLAMLRILDRSAARLSAANLHVVCVNVDDPANLQKARSSAERERFQFPVLFATDEVAGIYNIIYRHLFDRRRDLPIPIGFLLDTQGMIVKVYQGTIDSGRVLENIRSIPATFAARMLKSLPFTGMLVRNTFMRNDFTYGVAMFQHGYLDQAAASFEEVLTQKPDNADAHYNLGTLNLRRSDFTRARQYLEQTIKLQPNYPEAWNNLGMMAAQEGRLDESIQDFQQSLALRPRYAIALLNLGNVYRRQKAFDKAQECLTHALELLPDDAEINYSLGMLYAQQGQMKPASDYLQRALGLRPNYPEALNNLGVLFVRQQDFTRAEETFKTGIRVSPNFDQSYLNLARLYAMQHDRDKARGVLLELLHVQPDNSSAKEALEILQ